MSEDVVGEPLAEPARRAYARLLRLPLNSAERLHSQGYMAFLRDYIAQVEGRTSEDVQTSYEALNQPVTLPSGTAPA